MSEPIVSSGAAPPRERAAERIGRVLPGILIAIGLAVFAWIRVSVLTGEFGNNDVAGIAYEADTLLRGEVPYRDTWTLKPPGTFFVFAAVFGFVARDLRAIQVVLGLWLLVGAAGVHRSASALHGSRLVAALATALYLVSAGRFDINYSSWMAPAYVWAVAAVLTGLRNDSWRRHVYAGAWSVAAFHFKQPAIVLAPLAVVLWFHARSQHLPGARIRAFGGWMLGATAAALPLLAFYAFHGALGDLFRSLFPWDAFKDHVSTTSALAVPNIPGLSSLVLAQFFDLFPLTTGLVVVTLGGVLWRSRRGLPSESLFPGLAFFFLSLLGGAMSGARFYEHYAIQYLPALALLAAHPSGLLGLLRNGVPRGLKLAAASLAAVFVVLEVRQVAAGPVRTFDYRPPLLADGSTAARKAGEHIRVRTRPDETIYVWGWLARPVYFWAERRAPLAAYREMGRVTSVNTNTHWSSSQPFRFQPGPAADELVRAFEQRRPAYFVYSPYYVWQSGGGPEPLEEFEALKEILRRDYAQEAAYGNLVLYARKDRGPARSGP